MPSAVLANDLILNPYMLAWILAAEGMLLATAWCAGWIGRMCDFTSNGILSNVLLNIKQAGIAQKFVVRGMPDLLLVVIDWTFLLMGSCLTVH